MTNTMKVVSPKGMLSYVFISGAGRESLSGDMRYSASLILKNDSKDLALLIANIDEFWKANKPANAKKCKSNGIKIELDEEGNETGNTIVNFWTSTTWAPKGDRPETAKQVTVFDSKNNKVDMGDKLIGNGSEGRISGIAGIYETKSKEAGITLYLNSVQLTKFVEYEPETGFEEDTDSEGFEGFDESVSDFDADVPF